MNPNTKPSTRSDPAASSNLSRRTALGAVAGFAAASLTADRASGQSGAGGRASPVGNDARDANGIRFLSPGRGSTARSLQDELADLAVSPEQYGATGDGATDDTAALQAALDTGRSVRLTQGRQYLVRSKLTIAADGVFLSGGGRIRIAPDFRVTDDRSGRNTHLRVLFVTGSNVTIEGVTFDATRAPPGTAVENGFLWITAPWAAVHNCLFIGNQKGSCIWALGNAPYLSVLGCRFVDCSGAVVAKGRHTIISNNVIINATDAAIAINGQSCVGAVVSGNTIGNDKAFVIPSMIAVEEGASDWTITGNVLTGVNGGGIVCLNVLDSTTVKGGVIANNVIDAHLFDGTLPKSPNPAALLGISGSYTDWIAQGNRITGAPSGNSNSQLVAIAASGGLFHGNIIDGSGVGGLAAMIGISAGKGGLTIRDNKSRNAANGRHYLFGPGDYGNAPCRFIGGELLGGEEGINAEFHVARITGLTLQLDNITACTARSVVNATTIWGDRAAFLNAGAWARPHRVGPFTDMSCNAVPQRAGRIPFQPGDRLHYLAPRSGGYAGMIRVGNEWKMVTPVP